MRSSNCPGLLSTGLSMLLLAAASHSALAADVAALVNSNTTFALDLYQQVRNEDKNLVFSPQSISSALGLALAGARGKTANEMSLMMHVDPTNYHESMAELWDKLKPESRPDSVTLNMANGLWPSNKFKLQETYTTLCKKYYGADVQPLDFEGNASGSVKKINKWVEDHTGGLLKDVLSEGAVNSETTIVLSNALYLHALWVVGFWDGLTKPAEFHLSSGATKNVPFMHETGVKSYYADDSVQVLEIPYRWRQYSMLFVLPRAQNGLAAVEQSLNRATLEKWTTGLQGQGLEIAIPKFKVEQKIDLGSTLTKMGMGSAFAASADFSGIGNGPMRLSSAIHSAVIEIDEKGTTAAAATVMVGVATGAPLIDKEFTANHPFLFIVRNRETGTILFLGRVVNPGA